jgi:hypothetical protein
MESIEDLHTSHDGPNDRQEQPRGLFSFQNTTEFVHSSESLLNGHDRHVADVADSSAIGDDTPSPSNLPLNSRDEAPSLYESCEDIRALDPEDDAPEPEHDINATIASLETQVDHLCSLLDNFRSDFQTKLQAFREDIRTLPDRVGVAYSPRQRAHLLSMYGKSITEAGELALHKLQYDLARLASLDGDARLYEEYCSSVESSFVSSKGFQGPTDSMLEEMAGWKRRLRPFASLLRAVRLPKPVPASLDSFIDSFATEMAALDNRGHDEHATGQREEQSSSAQPEGVALRPHREVIIDWDRFCGDCPRRTETSYCKGCSGWRRGFEDPTWDGRESTESIEAVEAISKSIEW